MTIIEFASMGGRARAEKLSDIRRKEISRLANDAKALKKFNELLPKSKDVKIWKMKNPEKAFAQRKVFIAKRNGTLKKGICHCGDTKVQVHHEDYSKPLDIVWLCKKHHMEADKIRRKIDKIRFHRNNT